MNLSEPFIRRPVMTSLVMIGIFLFGVMAFKKLPVSDLPNIEYPTILVSAQNPGMDPMTMANNVATPLEQQIMTIPGIQTIVSQSSMGHTQIVLDFDLSRNIDGAASDVMQAINAANGNLPPEMPSSPTYTKVNPADTPVIYIAVSSDSMTLDELYDYANTAAAQRFSMVQGAAQVQVYGSKRAIRIKVNPDRLAAMNLGIDTLTNAIVNANQSLPTGMVYDRHQAYNVVAQGQVETAEAYNQLIVREKDTEPVFLSQVGKAVTGTQDEDYYLNFWSAESGKRPTIVVAVMKESGYNTVKLCQEIKGLLPELKKVLPGSIDLSIIYDQSVVIEESIDDVQMTLVLAFFLVVFVIFLFLGRLSTTLIPSLALPLAVAGTFAVMYINGYDIDILSMLGLTLVVGFLVDDAIVVLENIVRHLDEGKSPLQAALDGSRQISGTVLSMTLSLAAVFIPLIFMPGILGRVFSEFGMVIVIAVLFSGFISLTFTPLLCSRFLRKKVGEGLLERMAKKIVGGLLHIYEPALLWVLRYRWVPIAVIAAALFITAYLYAAIPQDFLPPGDTGVIEGVVIASQGSAYMAMEQKMEQVVEIVKKNPYINGIIAVANMAAYTLPNQGIVFFVLVPSSQRPPIQEVVEQLNEAFQELVGVQAFIYPIPEINLNVGTGIQRADYMYSLSTMDDPNQLYAVTKQLTEKLKQLPQLQDVSSNIEVETPQTTVTILRDQASQYGISAKTIEQAFNLGYGGGRVTTIKTPINIYNVIVQMEDAYRKNPDALAKIYLTSTSSNIRASSNTRSSTSSNAQERLVPLRAVATWKETVGPLAIFHNNQFTSSIIYFNVAKGAALGTAIEAFQDVVRQVVPENIMKSFLGQAQVFQETIPKMAPLLAIGVLVIYLLLGSLYESFVHPLTILSALPGAVFGGLAMLFFFQETLSLYSYVGMIVLIGIVMKNGIMLIEFANENVDKGQDPYDAIIEAAKVRFRPILMTTVAAAMGAVPIALGLGADAASRRSLGLVILGGLFFSQLITYFFTPVVYLLIEQMKSRLSRSSRESSPP
ncbi:MAG: efflux RND transporter permease subunit [Waddliaceae bacterium]